MRKRGYAKNVVALFTALAVPFLLSHPALAAGQEITQVENFIKTIVEAMATIAGFVAAAFFVIGGYSYITSTGNPEKLDKAKQTIKYSAIGLVVVIAAFVITSFVSSTAKGAFGG